MVHSTRGCIGIVVAVVVLVVGSQTDRQSSERASERAREQTVRVGAHPIGERGGTFEQSQ